MVYIILRLLNSNYISIHLWCNKLNCENKKRISPKEILCMTENNLVDAMQLQWKILVILDIC